MTAKKQIIQFKEDTARIRIENVATDEIRADHLVQPRARLDPNVIAEYCDLMLNGGVEFPPVAVVLVDSGYLLVDGYLRFEAAKLAKLKTLRCEVRRGDLRSALLFSTAVNARHGLRRTWDDKRRAVGKLLDDHEWSQWSNREIARQCSVSHGFVAQERDRLRPVTGNVTKTERRFICKHGSIATMTLSERPQPKLSPMPPAEIVSLSAVVHDHRSTFVSELRVIEEALANLPPISAVRGGRTADAILIGRLKAIAQKASALAERLITDPGS
jgi:hypothetical protein